MKHQLRGIKKQTTNAETHVKNRQKVGNKHDTNVRKKTIHNIQHSGHIKEGRNSERTTQKLRENKAYKHRHTNRERTRHTNIVDIQKKKNMEERSIYL